LIALAVSGRAETHLERGELELAARELERATALATQAGDEIGLLEIARLNAMLALASGDPASAFELAETARRRPRTLQSLQLEGECTAVAALACQQLGRGERCGSTARARPDHFRPPGRQVAGPGTRASLVEHSGAGVLSP
jgi:hypothetical protein